MAPTKPRRAKLWPQVEFYICKLYREVMANHLGLDRHFGVGCHRLMVEDYLVVEDYRLVKDDFIVEDYLVVEDYWVFEDYFTVKDYLVVEDHPADVSRVIIIKTCIFVSRVYRLYLQAGVLPLILISVIWIPLPQNRGFFEVERGMGGRPNRG